MTRIAFVYNVFSVLLGCAAFFAAMVAMAMPADLHASSAERAATVAIAAAIAFGAVAALVALRRRRARWLREEAIYESYDAFAATAKEHKGVIHEVGRMFLFRGPLGLLGATRRASIREAYHQLQSARRRTAITEPEYRAAIDELLSRAARRGEL